MIYDRFDLEDAMSRMLDADNEIEDIIYKIGDCADRPTEDDLLNMLIGVKTLNQTRYARMWQIFESMIKEGTILSKTKENAKTLEPVTE